MFVLLIQPIRRLLPPALVSSVKGYGQNKVDYSSWSDGQSGCMWYRSLTCRAYQAQSHEGLGGGPMNHQSRVLPLHSDN